MSGYYKHTVLDAAREQRSRFTPAGDFLIRGTSLALSKELARYGKEGWHIVAVVPSADGCVVFLSLYVAEGAPSYDLPHTPEEE